MNSLFRWTVWCACAVLSACIVTEDPVIGPQRAHEVPGLAGFWVPAGAGENLFLRVNSDGSYSQGNTAGELAAEWRVQRLGQAEYLLEVRLPKEDPRYGLLLFFEHYPGYLRFFGVSATPWCERQQARRV